MTRYFFSEEGNYLGGFDGSGALAMLPKGAIQVEQPPAHGLDRLVDGVIVPYVPPVSLAEELNAVFQTLDEDTQADLAPLKAAVKLELDQGRAGIAKRIIRRANIPPELESVREAMLEKFQE